MIAGRVGKARWVACACLFLAPPLAVDVGSLDDDLAREVATIRGLPLKSHLEIVHLDDAAFAEHTRSRPADRATTATYVAFGFMRHDPHAPPPVLGHAGYLGLFDFATHALLLRQDLPRDEARGVLVHEMAHALQDQNFGMPAVDDDDRALAIKSLYEGDATLVRELYAAKGAGQSPSDRVAQAILIVRTHPREELAVGLGIPMDAIKEPRFGETLATYVDGMVFVGTLHQKGGFDLVNQAYSRLPVSTEQILHPDKYLSNELPVHVATPVTASGQTKIAEGTLGELRMRLFLGRCSKTPSVDGWGWGGDRFVITEGRDQALSLTWSTAWDSEGDAMRFELALRNVASHCWPSSPRGGFWIGESDSLHREGTRVTYSRG